MANITVNAGDEIRSANRVSVRTSTGRVYVFTTSYDGTNIVISANKGNQDGEPTSFTTPATLSEISDSLADVGCAVAIDSTDIIHCIFYRENTSGMGVEAIRYVTFDTSNDTFGTPESVTTLDLEASFTRRLGIALDVNNIPHIIYRDVVKNMGTDEHGNYYANRIGGSWNTPVRISFRGVDATIMSDIIIADPSSGINSDRPIVVEGFYASTTPEINIYHGDALNATSFTQASDITGNIDVDDTNRIPPSLAIDSNEKITVTFTEDTSNDLMIVEHLNSSAWGTWETPVDVDTSTDYLSPSIAINGTDRYIYVEDSVNSDLNLWKDEGSGWTEETADADLPNVGTFADVKVKWSRYNNNDPTGLDYVFEDGNGDILYNTFLASSTTTVQKTFTVDALLALLVQKTFSIDSLLKQLAISKSLTIDSLLQKLNQKTNTIDAFIQDTFQKTFSADSLLVNIVTKTFSSDSILVKTVQKTFESDAILKSLAKTKNTTIDALLQLQNKTKTTLVDSLLLQTVQKTSSIDSRLVFRKTKDFLTDSILKITNTKNTLVDSLLKITNQKTVTSDSILVKTVQKTFSGDAILKSLGNIKTATIDSLLKITNTKTTLFDSLLQSLKQKTFSSDSLLVKKYQKTFSSDSILKSLNNLKTTTIDSLIQAQQLTKQFSIDSILNKTIQKTFSIDSILKKLSISKTTSVDSLLETTNTKTSTIDSLIKVLNLTKNVVVDSILKITNTKSLSLDAILRQTKTKTSSIDSFLSQQFQKLLSLDSSLILKGNKSTSTDSILKEENKLKTFSLDAVLIEEAVIVEEFTVYAQSKEMSIFSLPKTFSVHSHEKAFKVRKVK